MIADYASNVLLVLLQIVLQRQQSMCYKDKTLNYDKLLQEPLVDDETLELFRSHGIVIMYSPELCDFDLEQLKDLVHEIFSEGIPGSNAADTPVNVITLANYYYYTRIQEIEKDLLPELRNLMRPEVQSMKPT